jgi:hypothetical protein
MDGPLLYLHEHKVIVCSICGHCIKGDGVDLHLQKFHKDVHLNVRKEWCQRVKETTWKPQHVQVFHHVLLTYRLSLRLILRRCDVDYFV